MVRHMQISFVVPAYNEEALLTKCLVAIQKEIIRVGCQAEIIVVNNASTDTTREIAAAMSGVVVVDEPIKGLVQARQAGFLASSGELVANIDADTVITEGWLETALAEFARIPRLVALSGPHVYYDVPFRVRTIAHLLRNELPVLRAQPIHSKGRVDGTGWQFHRPPGRIK